MPLTDADLDRIAALARAVALLHESGGGEAYCDVTISREEDELLNALGLYGDGFATVLALVEAARRGLACGCVIGPALVGELIDGVVCYRPATAADTGPARELTAEPRPAAAPATP